MTAGRAGGIPTRRSGWPVLRTPRWMLAGGAVLVAGLTLAALREIQSGASHDIRTAVNIATYGAANCSPANNTQMDDLVEYQPPESLASFHLEVTVNDLVTWGFPDAQRVQTDVATLLTATTPSAIRAATAQLHHDQSVLDAERATIDGMINEASKSLSAGVAPPALPS